MIRRIQDETWTQFRLLALDYFHLYVKCVIQTSLKMEILFNLRSRRTCDLKREKKKGKIADAD